MWRCGLERELNLIKSIVMPGEADKEKRQRVEGVWRGRVIIMTNHEIYTGSGGAKNIKRVGNSEGWWDQ